MVVQGVHEKYIHPKLRKLGKKYGFNRKTILWIGKHVNEKQWEKTFRVFKKHEIEVGREGVMKLKGKHLPDVKKLLERGVKELNTTLEFAKKNEIPPHHAVRIVAKSSYEALEKTMRWFKERKDWFERKGIHKERLINWVSIYGHDIVKKSVEVALKHDLDPKKFIYGVSALLGELRRAKIEDPESQTLEIIDKASKFLTDPELKNKPKSLLVAIGIASEKNLKKAIEISKKWKTNLVETVKTLESTDEITTKNIAYLKNIIGTRYKMSTLAFNFNLLKWEFNSSYIARQILKEALLMTKEEKISLTEAIKKIKMKIK